MKKITLFSIIGAGLAVLSGGAVVAYKAKKKKSEVNPDDIIEVIPNEDYEEEDNQ